MRTSRSKSTFGLVQNIKDNENLQNLQNIQNTHNLQNINNIQNNHGLTTADLQKISDRQMYENSLQNHNRSPHSGGLGDGGIGNVASYKRRHSISTLNESENYNGEQGQCS